MKTLHFDFLSIEEYEDFYAELKKQTELPECFGDNLDALFDWLTGDAEMPMKFELENLNLNQLEEFDELITTLDDVMNENEDFDYSLAMLSYEDEDNE